jgi:ribose-phosphate pyrophosphokinase
MTIIIGSEKSSNRILKLAQLTGYRYLLYKERVFPNGEVLVYVENPKAFRNNAVHIFIETYPDTNSQIIKLLELLEIVNHYGVDNITLMIPYLSYSRQDKRFRPGEPITIKMLIEILNFYKISRLISFEVHNPQVIYKYADFTFTNLSIGVDLVKKVIDSLGNSEVFLMAPDKGRWDTVNMIAKALDLPSGYIMKIRDLETGTVSMKGIVGDLRPNIPVILLDDEISTGGTMALATDYLKKQGINRVQAVATHLLLVKDAEKKLFNSGVDNIFGSNTIPNKYAILEVEPYIAKEIV